MSGQATLYHRPDGHLLAYLPDGGTDPDFEQALREQGVPFRKRALDPAAMPHGLAVDSASNERVRVPALHLHHYRTDTVEDDGGGVTQRHFFHHRDGTKRVFETKALRAPASVPDSFVEDDAGDSAPARTAAPAAPAAARRVPPIAGADPSEDVPALRAADHEAIARHVVALLSQGGES
jgi:hypothetical protein